MVRKIGVLLLFFVLNSYNTLSLFPKGARDYVSCFGRRTLGTETGRGFPYYLSQIHHLAHFGLRHAPWMANYQATLGRV